MKNQIIAFWVWNKRKSPMTFAPSKKASGKLSFKVRTLQSLSGVSLYRRAEKQMRKLRKGWAQ